VIVVGNRGTLTGAGIDEGLLGYMDCFHGIPFNYGAKVQQSTIRACDGIHFTGQQRFSSLPNTAVYFPLLYAPQALALALGERSGLSVRNSYYLARLFATATTLALLMWALLIYPAPPAAIALFTLPMCLFQLSSASLDAVTFATTVVAASLFLRGYSQELSFSRLLQLALATCLLLLATSRIIYIALSPLLLVLYRVRRSPIYIISFFAVFALSLAWTAFALSTVHGQGAIAQETSAADIVRFYVVHPGAFLGVIFRTLTKGSVLRGYWQMFVGVLGWLDTPIGVIAYVVFAIELTAIFVVSISIGSLRSLNTGHLALACTTGAATLLLFLVALSAWTIHPATVIEGVQGRYFYPIAILFVYSFWSNTSSRTGITLSFAILIVMVVSSAEFGVPRLLYRYYAN
jgi:uncharacterized membrane protein